MVSHTKIQNCVSRNISCNRITTDPGICCIPKSISCIIILERCRKSSDRIYNSCPLDNLRCFIHSVAFEFTAGIISVGKTNRIEKTQPLSGLRIKKFQEIKFHICFNTLMYTICSICAICILNYRLQYPSLKLRRSGRYRPDKIN